jgi:glycosyltransferase involved in cell wall biosynthesis
MARHWAINGRFLTQPVTGVQRYGREILSALDALMADAVPLANGLSVELLVPPDFDEGLSLKAIKIRKVGSTRGHAWEQTILPTHVRGGLLSLCNLGPLATRKQILCIHDVNTRVCPQSYSAQFRLLYRSLIPLLGRTVRKVTTVSQYSASELRHHKICPAADVVGNGHEHALRWGAIHSNQTREISGPRTIVVLGSTVPHKNVGLILSLQDRLAAVGLRVAVVGASSSRVFGKVDYKDAENITWLGRTSDAELRALLQDCLCLAFPSLVEGFGLPPLEAMALGCPVVMSDRASLPEVGGDAVLYASPENADQWLNCFMRLLDDEQLRIKLVQRGREQAAQFRWAASAQRYLELMRGLDGSTPAAELRDYEHAN